MLTESPAVIEDEPSVGIIKGRTGVKISCAVIRAPWRSRAKSEYASLQQQRNVVFVPTEVR